MTANDPKRTLGAFMRLLYVCVFFVSSTLAASASNMFPLPQGAIKPDHVVLSPRIAEQDYFWMKAEYPATPALEHYSTVFAGWTQCGDPAKGWVGYGDLSNGNKRYLHHFVRYWISPANDRAVTLLFQYRSKGVESRKRPDSDDQFIALIQHRIPDAVAHFASIDVTCPKAPKSTVDGDSRKSGARPNGGR